MLCKYVVIVLRKITWTIFFIILSILCTYVQNSKALLPHFYLQSKQGDSALLQTDQFHTQSKTFKTQPYIKPTNNETITWKQHKIKQQASLIET